MNSKPVSHLYLFFILLLFNFSSINLFYIIIFELKNMNG